MTWVSIYSINVAVGYIIGAYILPFFIVKQIVRTEHYTYFFYIQRHICIHLLPRALQSVVCNVHEWVLKAYFHCINHGMLLRLRNPFRYGDVVYTNQIITLTMNVKNSSLHWLSTRTDLIKISWLNVQCRKTVMNFQSF